MKNNKNELYKTKQFKSNAGTSAFLTVPLDPVVFRKYDIDFLDFAIYEFMRFRANLSEKNRYDNSKTEIQVFFNISRKTVYSSINKLVKAELLVQKLDELKGKNVYYIASSASIDSIHERIEKKTARENFKIHQENERLLKQIKKEERLSSGHFANERTYTEEEYNAMITPLEDIKV